MEITRSFLFLECKFYPKRVCFNPIFYLFAAVWHGLSSLHSFEIHHSPLLNGKEFEMCWASVRHNTHNICYFIYSISLFLRYTIFLYVNTSELCLLHYNHCRSYGSLGYMNLADCWYFYHLTQVIYTISTSPVEFNCYFKMSSEILHYNLALKQKFILNAESHETRTPLVRQCLTLG